MRCSSHSCGCVGALFGSFFGGSPSKPLVFHGPIRTIAAHLSGLSLVELHWHCLPRCCCKCTTVRRYRARKSRRARGDFRLRGISVGGVASRAWYWRVVFSLPCVGPATVSPSIAMLASPAHPSCWPIVLTSPRLGVTYGALDELSAAAGPTLLIAGCPVLATAKYDPAWHGS